MDNNLLPQLTVFTTCKPFVGEIAAMQRNAIYSWQALGLKIVLIGNDLGTAKVAAETGAVHIADVLSTPGGIPLVSSLFGTAQQNTDTAFLAYLNSDIILLPNFIEALTPLLLSPEPNANLLLSARRINIPLSELIVNQQPDWQRELDKRCSDFGSWDYPNAVDLFLFNRDLYRDIPDFAIGRMQWDNWLIWSARQAGAKVIDASLDFALIHPVHGYAIHSQGWQEITQGADSQMNRKLAKNQLLELESGSTHLLEHGELIPNDAQNRKKIANTCKPSPTKELLGTLKYLSVNTHRVNQSVTHQPRNLQQAIDTIRTLLYRHKEFVPQKIDSLASEEEFDQCITRSLDYMETRGLDAALHALQSLVAKPLLELLKQVERSGRPIVIWGAGQLGIRLKALLNRHQLVVSGFVDTDPNKKGLKIECVPVLAKSWKELMPLMSARPYVLIGSMYFSEIEKQLKQHGLSPNEDYSG